MQATICRSRIVPRWVVKDVVRHGDVYHLEVVLELKAKQATDPRLHIAGVGGGYIVPGSVVATVFNSRKEVCWVALAVGGFGSG